MNDRFQMKSPGELISEAREAQDLTLAQLSNRTKIPPPVLKALERDEYHKISGPLYIKSFLRTCAVDLGLDPEVVLGEYGKIAGEREAGPQGKDMVWGEDEVQVSTIGLPWLRIVLVVGVVAVLMGLGLFALRGGEGDDAPDEAAESPLAVAVVPTESPTDRQPELQTEPDEIQKSSEAGAASQETPRAQPDTLVLGWSLNPVESPPAPVRSQDNPPAEPAAATSDNRPAESSSAPPVMVPVEVEEETLPPVAEEPATETAPSGALTTDSEWPLVLRVACDRPQRIRVKQDGDREFSEVRWPADAAAAPALPAAGFEPGQAYGENGRLVVFWGGDDHFSLILERIPGVVVTLNGRVRDISKLRPGQEILLDVHSAGPGSGR